MAPRRFFNNERKQNVKIFRKHNNSKNLKEKGFSPLDYRYLVLTTHYREQLQFSIENLTSAKNAYQRLKNICVELKDDKKINKSYLEEFTKTLEEDLNTPKALQVLWKLIRDEKADGKYQTIKKIDEVFGLDLLKKEKITIPKEIKKLIEERESARKSKDWKKADELRIKINTLGYQIDDSSKGTMIKKISG